MIKFYQGTYAELSQSPSKLDSANNICFVTDRQVLIMGGKEYGKDGGAIKIEATSGQTGATGSKGVASGTLFAFKGDQSLFRYNGPSDWEQIFDPTLSSQDLIASTASGVCSAIVFTERGNSDSFQATAKDVALATSTLESKVSAAYTQAGTVNPVSGTNTVVVSKDAGIARTAFTLNQDRGLISVVTDNSGARSVAGTATDTILVTETTLSEQTNDILANGLEIRKKATAEAGYRASYGLYNRQTGLQLGDTINIVKDQFLKGAAYVAAWEHEGTYVEWPLGADGQPVTKPTEITDNAITDRNQLNRYLKLTFALPATATSSASGRAADISPDSSDVTYATENDTVVYININELFDSYKGVNGVRVLEDSNIIVGAVDASTEVGYSSSDAKGTKGVHYGATAYLTVGNGTTQTQDFAVNGIKKDISASIEDLDNPGTGVGKAHATANMWLTDVGVDNGRLTGAYLSAYTSGINFNGTEGTGVLLTDTDSQKKALAIPSGTYVTAQQAISAIATHIGNSDYSYDGTAGNGSDTKFIYAITQVDGKITETSAMAIDASNLKATSWQTAKLSGAAANTAGIQTVEKTAIYVGDSTGTAQVHLQDALTSLAQSTYDAIAAMDLNLVGVKASDANNGGTANKYGPESSNATTTSNTEAYRIVNTVKQSDGNVYANDIEYSAPYIYFSGIAAVAGADAAARVAVNGMNVNAAINSISNTIAKLDFTDAGAGSAPASGANTKYSIVNTVSQTDGQLAETKIDLTAANTFFDAINGKLGYTGSNTGSVSPDEARVALLTDDTTQAKLGGAGKNGSIQLALDNISNILADYLSFHDATGNVI